MASMSGPISTDSSVYLRVHWDTSARTELEYCDNLLVVEDPSCTRFLWHIIYITKSRKGYDSHLKPLKYPCFQCWPHFLPSSNFIPFAYAPRPQALGSRFAASMYNVRGKHVRLNRLERGLGSLVGGIADGVKDVGGQLADGAGDTAVQAAGDAKTNSRSSPTNVTSQSAVSDTSNTGSRETPRPLSPASPSSIRDDVNTQSTTRTSSSSTASPTGKPNSTGGSLGNLPIVGQVVGDVTGIVGGGDKAEGPASDVGPSSHALPTPTPSGNDKKPQDGGNFLGNVPVLGKIVGDTTDPLRSGGDSPEGSSTQSSDVQPTPSLPQTPKSKSAPNILGSIPILGQVGEDVGKVVGGGVKVMEGAASGVGHIVEGLSSVAGDGVGAVASVAAGAIHGATSVVGNVASAATAIAGESVDDVASLGGDVVGAATTLGGKVFGAATSLVGDVGGTVTTLVEDGVKAVKALPKDPIGAVTGLVEDLPSAVAPLVTDAVEIPVSLVGDVVSVVVPLGNRVVNIATDLVGDIVGNATSIILGDALPLATSVIGGALPIVPSLISEIDSVVETGLLPVVTSLVGGGVGEVGTVIGIVTSAAGDIVTAIPPPQASAILTSATTSQIGGSLPLPLPTLLPPPDSNTEVTLPLPSPTTNETTNRPATPAPSSVVVGVPPTVSPLVPSTTLPLTAKETLPPVSSIIPPASVRASVFPSESSRTPPSASPATGTSGLPVYNPSLGVPPVALAAAAQPTSNVGSSDPSGTDSVSPSLPTLSPPNGSPHEHPGPISPAARGGVLVTGLVVLFIIISYTLYRCRRRRAIRLNRSSGSSWAPLVEKRNSASPSPQQLEEGGVSDRPRQSCQSSFSGVSMDQVTNRDYQATTRNSGPITLHNPFWDSTDAASAHSITLSRTPSLTHSISSDSMSTDISDGDKSSRRALSFLSEHSTTTTASSIAIAGPGSNRKESVFLGHGPRLAALFGIFGASGHYAPNKRDTVVSKVSQVTQIPDLEAQAISEKRISTSAQSDTGSTKNAILNATWNSPFLVSLMSRVSLKKNRT